MCFRGVLCNNLIWVDIVVNEIVGNGTGSLTTNTQINFCATGVIGMARYTYAKLGVGSKHLNQLVKFKTGLDVRIGFPGEKMAADSSDEINQPMFSTSVGLLLKGLEYYEEKQEEMVISNQKEFEEQVPLEEEKKERKGIKKGKILENLKNTLSDIFDETDVKM